MREMALPEDEEPFKALNNIWSQNKKSRPMSHQNVPFLHFEDGKIK